MTSLRPCPFICFNRLIVFCCFMILPGCMPVIIRVLPETKGVVLDADTNKPILVASVKIDYLNTGVSGTAQAVTDRQGRFKIRARHVLRIMIAPNDANMGDQIHCTVSASGYVPASWDRFHIFATTEPVTVPVSTMTQDPKLGMIFHLKGVSGLPAP